MVITTTTTRIQAGQKPSYHRRRLGLLVAEVHEQHQAAFLITLRRRSYLLAGQRLLLSTLLAAVRASGRCQDESGWCESFFQNQIL